MTKSLYEQPLKNYRFPSQTVFGICTICQLPPFLSMRFLPFCLYLGGSYLHFSSKFFLVLKPPGLFLKQKDQRGKAGS